MENKTIRVRSNKDIITFTSLLIIGALMCGILRSASGVVAGTTFIVLGIILAIVLKSEYVIAGEHYHRVTLNCDRKSRDGITSFLSGRTPEFHHQEGDGALLLYVYASNGRKKGDNAGRNGYGYAIMYEFSNYEYRPCTDLIPVSDTQIKKMTTSK